MANSRVDKYYKYKPPKKKKKRKYDGRIVILIIAIITISSASAFFMKYLNDKGFFEKSNEIVDGSLDDEVNEEENNEKVDATQFAYKISSYIYFKNDYSSGLARIENPSKNIYNMVVEIYINDGETLVYTSPKIKPNQYIEKITLSETLEKGKYEAIAYFIAYDPETNEKAGKTGAELIIEIEN